MNVLNLLLPPIAPALREMSQITQQQQQQQQIEVEDSGSKIALPSSVQLALADKRLVSNALSTYGLAHVAEHLFAFDTFSQLQFEMIEPIMERVHDNIFAGVPPGAGKTALA